MTNQPRTKVETAKEILASLGGSVHGGEYYKEVKESFRKLNTKKAIGVLNECTITEPIEVLGNGNCRRHIQYRC